MSELARSDATKVHPGGRLLAHACVQHLVSNLYCSTLTVQFLLCLTHSRERKPPRYTARKCTSGRLQSEQVFTDRWEGQHVNIRFKLSLYFAHCLSCLKESIFCRELSCRRQIGERVPLCNKQIGESLARSLRNKQCHSPFTFQLVASTLTGQDFTNVTFSRGVPV